MKTLLALLVLPVLLSAQTTRDSSIQVPVQGRQIVITCNQAGILTQMTVTPEQMTAWARYRGLGSNDTTTAVPLSMLEYLRSAIGDAHGKLLVQRYADMGAVDPDDTMTAAQVQAARIDIRRRSLQWSITRTVKVPVLQ